MDTPLAEPRRVEELWFEDGNLVIQAGTSLFRVYRGVLRRASSVFDDMLSFPQPPDSELFEGCPVVRLTDSEAEVEVFLKALFDPEFFMPFPTRTEYETLVGCLRLSHKYGVDYLRRRALIHFSSGYDTKLSRWDTATNDFDDDLPASEMVSWPWHKNPAADILSIQLFREVDAPWLLPNAFYNLSAAFHRLGSSIFQGTVFNGRPASLSVQDQESFARGHTIQSQSSATEILSFLADPLYIAGCAIPTDCALERFRVTKRMPQLIYSCPSNPLQIWGTDEWALFDNICPVCLSALKKVHQECRQAFWDGLPNIYGLPPWEELEATQVVATGTSRIY
ncbi:hypothetical protein B0H19DRAFT_978031 [Mycena capillaripes]|nr:hypothetical protein B0H19DRAFT_978031 [Mycena capillaripes]